MGIPDHLTCFLRNLYAGQEATVRTGHGTTDWFQRGKGVRQGCILSPYLFNFYAEYIMRNTGLEEAQAGIKIAGRNINNLRKWQPIPVFLPGKSHGRKSLVGCSPWGCEESDTPEPSAGEDGGVSGVSSSCGARGGFLPIFQARILEWVAIPFSTRSS